MRIKLEGNNKKEIRNLVHEVEEKGLLIKRCVNKYEEGGLLVREFDCEVQFGNWNEIEKEYLNKKELVDFLAPIINISKKELNIEIAKHDLPYWVIGCKIVQFLRRIDNLALIYSDRFKVYGENMVYVLN